jgi:hypothetical protein
MPTKCGPNILQIPIENVHKKIKPNKEPIWQMHPSIIFSAIISNERDIKKLKLLLQRFKEKWTPKVKDEEPYWNIN